MTEIARIRWRSHTPTEVDEVLVVNADGTGRLVVRSSRDGSPVIGTFEATLSAAELTLLDGQRREVDARRPDPDAVTVTAASIATAARTQPLATATFYLSVVPGGVLALQAVGAGQEPTAFELDPGSAIVHVERDGHEIAWHDMDRLETGFVSPEPPRVWAGSVDQPRSPPGRTGPSRSPVPRSPDRSRRPSKCGDGCGTCCPSGRTSGSGCARRRWPSLADPWADGRSR